MYWYLFCSFYSQGVQIPNFGTFSFSQRKLDVGNNKFVLMQRPVFNISEKFAQTHALQFTKYNVPGKQLISGWRLTDQLISSFISYAIIKCLN